MKKLINTVLVILLFVLLGLGAKDLYMFLKVDADNGALREAVVKVPTDPDDEDLGDDYDPDDPFNRYIDFSTLKGINEDIVGWIYIPGTKVDYPILVGDTDEKYLSRDFKGNYDYLGSIFGYSNVSLLNDSHICLFGHNMISGQMFGSLKSYKEEDFAKTNSKAYIYTPERAKECSLISVFLCQNTDSIFELDKTGSSDNIENIKESVVSRSMFELPVNEEFSNQIFTLGTCSGRAGGTRRLTLHFEVTKEKFVLE